jgi:prolipoprotein diacylglyceryl transferase
MYGICIALGCLAAIWLSSRRWQSLGGSADDVAAIAVWGIPAGVIGARIYHVITDYQLYTDDPLKALAVWDGGLGIWGGIAAGTAAGMWVARRRGLDVVSLMDVAAPAIVLAQAIGRFGNYFNQELFGRASTMPWAVEIDPVFRPSETMQIATYHPTFFYEALWNVAICVGLLLAGKYLRLAKGNLFALYVAGYTFGRFFIEALRVDSAHEILGMRVNSWVSLIIFGTAIAVLVIRQRRQTDVPPTVPVAG